MDAPRAGLSSIGIEHGEFLKKNLPTRSPPRQPLTRRSTIVFLRAIHPPTTRAAGWELHQNGRPKRDRLALVARPLRPTPPIAFLRRKLLSEPHRDETLPRQAGYERRCPYRKTPRAGSGAARVKG